MWPSYLINMEKDVDRLENSRRQLDEQKIAFTRIEGVNGRQMNPEAIARVYDANGARRRYKYPLIAPEIGCYMSHVSAWEKIAEGEAEGGFIFEDDFQINTPLEPILSALSASNESWDMVKLFSLNASPPTIRTSPLTGEHALTTPYQVPTCLLGYGIRREAAARLVQNSLPFFRPVDEDHKFFWEKDLRVDLVLPCPLQVGDQSSQTGTIGNARREERASKLRRAARSAKSIVYQINYKSSLAFNRRFGDPRHRIPK